MKEFSKTNWKLEKLNGYSQNHGVFGGIVQNCFRFKVWLSSIVVIEHDCKFYERRNSMLECGSM